MITLKGGGVIQQKFYMGEIGNSLLTINVISSSIPGIMPLFFVYLTNNNMCTYLPFYFLYICNIITYLIYNTFTRKKIHL